MVAERSGGHPKYACRACEEAVVQAAAPERLIKGGLPTEAMVAYVLVAKYAWHLPLYRQAQMLLAQGLDIKRAVLAFWVGYAAAELKPLYIRLRELILASGKIAVDETVAPVLDPGRGRTKKGYFWAIARDDRPWSGTDPPAVTYSYAPGRGAVHALKLLEHYRGIVQCDGYAAYKSIADAAGGEAITLAFCWAHLRRRFFDIAEDGSAPIASEALDRIAALYAIEKTIRGHSSCARRATRQEKSKPLVLALKKWFEQQLTRVSAKSVIAEAIRYALHHWDGLTRFLDDGRIELDRRYKFAMDRAVRPRSSLSEASGTAGASLVPVTNGEKSVGSCSAPAGVTRTDVHDGCSRADDQSLSEFSRDRFLVGRISGSGSCSCASAQIGTSEPPCSSSLISDAHAPLRRSRSRAARLITDVLPRGWRTVLGTTRYRKSRVFSLISSMWP